MKHLKFKTFLLLLFAVGIFTSCETENLQQEENSELIVNNKSLNNEFQQEENSDYDAHYELIKEKSRIYNEKINNRGSGGSPLPLYFCSEQIGGYTPVLYVNHQVYLNDSFDPTKQADIKNKSTNRYATWMTNLQRWLTHDFNDTNPGGSNATSIDMFFYLYGANGGGTLSATDGNRAYNEFVCQLMDQLSVNSVSELDDYEFSLYFEIDYLLCCSDDPYLYVSGTAYN